MNYEETLSFLYGQLPMFHRIGKAAYKANLNNACFLDEMCGQPHRDYRTIHVAGTNGKGSVSHMLASVLQAAGYRTGLFTSPHLVDFRERIRVNGTMIPEEAVTDFIMEFKDKFQPVKPSFFELTSAMAFYYFKQEAIDVVVIETGLGGRLDSTNIILPVLSVITNIGYDHMDILGDTLAKIAAEKAGIIKERIPVVIGESLPETRPVFEKAAADKAAPLFFTENHYRARRVESDEPGCQKLEVRKTDSGLPALYYLDMLGLYQQKNICTTLMALDLLKELQFTIPEDAIAAGLKNSSVRTGLRGRWEVMAQHPLTVCDTGHNHDGIRWVVEQIGQLSFEKLHFIFGVVNDKDISNILPLLPVDASYYFTKADIPRALDAEELKRIAVLAGLQGEAYATVVSALDAARKNAGPNDLIFIGGSTFVVADALQVK